MTAMPRTITKDKLAAGSSSLDGEKSTIPITVLPVVDGNNVCLGIVHITDLLRRGIV